MMSATTHSGNTMHDSPPVFGDIRPDAADFADLPPVNVVETASDDPDADLIDKRKRKPGAEKYEKKARNLFQFAFNVTVRKPAMVPDAAAILMYGPDIAESWGDLAAENAWVAKAIDMMSDTTENAAAALMMSATPFILQVLRNHEPTVEVEPKGIRIPFTKRMIRVRWNIKLKRLRGMTHPPEAITDHVFSNPAVQAKLEKQGIRVRTNAR